MHICSCYHICIKRGLNIDASNFDFLGANMGHGPDARQLLKIDQHAAPHASQRGAPPHFD